MAEWQAVLEPPTFAVEDAVSHAFVRDPLTDPERPVWQMAFAVCGWANRTGTRITPGEPFCPDCLAAAPAEAREEGPTDGGLGFVDDQPCADCGVWRRFHEQVVTNGHPWR